MSEACRDAMERDGKEKSDGKEPGNPLPTPGRLGTSREMLLPVNSVVGKGTSDTSLDSMVETYSKPSATTTALPTETCMPAKETGPSAGTVSVQISGTPAPNVAEPSGDARNVLPGPTDAAVAVATNRRPLLSDDVLPMAVERPVPTDLPPVQNNGRRKNRGDEASEEQNVVKGRPQAPLSFDATRQEPKPTTGGSSADVLPPVRRLCRDCASSMLSYVSVVHDVLNSVAADIIGKYGGGNSSQSLPEEALSAKPPCVLTAGGQPCRFVRLSEGEGAERTFRNGLQTSKGTLGSRLPRRGLCDAPSLQAHLHSPEATPYLEHLLPPVLTTAELPPGHVDDRYNTVIPTGDCLGAGGGAEDGESVLGASSLTFVNHYATHRTDSDRATPGDFGASPAFPVASRALHNDGSIDSRKVSANDSRSTVCLESVASQIGTTDDERYCRIGPAVQTIWNLDEPVDASEPARNGSTESAVPAGKPEENYVHGPTSLPEDLSVAVLALEESTRMLRRTKSWDQISEFVGEWLSAPAEPALAEEAFVTLATSNLEGLACLVLGNSLLMAGTARTLAVLITDGIAAPIRHLLGTVFHVVQNVKSLDSRGSTNLALLDEPELGVSFVKLHIWQLVQFAKCVFLDSSTLVVQNCDELFDREELSAVPDIGWPDCFNAAVFVYRPSSETYSNLIRFAEDHGSFDGGDQGLLNMYFSNWLLDATRRLPFVYNLMANVSYTYTPAFRQFGKDVKIVHFFGSYKPWHVQFHIPTGQMSPSANVHPTFARFVQLWLEICSKRIVPLLSNRVVGSSYVRPWDLLKEFPQPVSQDRMEGLPTAPSFRRSIKMPAPAGPPESVSEDRSDDAAGRNFPAMRSKTADEPPATAVPAAVGPEPSGDAGPLGATSPDGEAGVEAGASGIPGSEMGDYRGMAAWEQGTMDYMGKHSSDKILRRLDFLMTSAENRDG